MGVDKINLKNTNEIIKEKIIIILKLEKILILLLKFK